MSMKLFMLVCCLLLVSGKDIRGLFDCKQLGKGCDGLPKCCGTSQCYWKDGWSMFKDGVCVDCIKSGQKCQRDSQCCSGKICDKYSFHNIDGLCQVKRSGGPCYRNGQCQNKCNKSGVNIYGKCS